jgi:hypothetical protein
MLSQAAYETTKRKEHSSRSSGVAYSNGFFLAGMPGAFPCFPGGIEGSMHEGMGCCFLGGGKPAGMGVVCLELDVLLILLVWMTP